MPKKTQPLPVWKDSYSKLGVSARELYMRQNGLCWLKQEVDASGKVILHCTDGKDQAVTSRMFNPTIECVKCMTRFTENLIENEIKNNE